MKCSTGTWFARSPTATPLFHSTKAAKAAGMAARLHSVFASHALFCMREQGYQIRGLEPLAWKSHVTMV